MVDESPLGAFNCTTQGVADLLPAADIRDTLNPGQRGVTTGQVRSFVLELSARVDLRLTERARLTDQGRIDQVETAARDAIHNGAASYTQAARYPDQAGPNTDTYAAVLWKRYETTIAEIAAQLDAWLADSTYSTPETGSTPGWSFPAAQATETMPF